MSPRIALVAAQVRGEERWGEERFKAGVRMALEGSGMEMEVVPVEHDESSYEAVTDTYARYAALDLDGFDGVIASCIPGCLVKHGNKVAYLVRTARRYYDLFDRVYPSPTPEDRRLRRYIQDLDRDALKEAGRALVIGEEARGRLLKYLGVDSEVLHPFSTLEGARSESYEFLLLPGRLHHLKRVELVIAAMEHIKNRVELLVCGEGECEARLRAQASGMPQVHFLGKVDDERLTELYSRCLAVPCVPLGEDFGFVALEAASFGKPVITCADSGEPSRLVYDGRTGFVVPPDPTEIARRIDFFAASPDTAAAMGEIGRGAMAYVSPGHTASVLCDSLGLACKSSRPWTGARPVDSVPPPRTLVMGAGPLTPVTEGGAARTLGVFGGLGFEAKYLGVLEEKGETKKVRPTRTLVEVDVPLSDEHLAEREDIKNQPGGALALEVSFPLLGHLTPEYASTAGRLIPESDVLVFSRPWSYRLAADSAGFGDSLLVYDAHNVESVLRCAQLDDGGSGTEMVSFVGELESALCRDADLVLVPSHGDRLSICRLYGVPCEKIRVVPNGAFADRILPASHGRRTELREAMNLTHAEKEIQVAVFMGAASPANVDAAEFILREVAPALPDVTFVIFGGAGEAVSSPAPGNARILGMVDDERKAEILSLADVALNPVFSEIGSNVKVFDYMAAGLPVLSSPAAGRGIDLGGAEVLTFSTREKFVSDLRDLLEEPVELARSGAAGRRLVEERHSWEAISRDTGMLLRWHSWRRKRRRPFFSVIVPSYERPELLSRLSRYMAKQTFTDFEVVIVDQSQSEWAGSRAAAELDLLYYRTRVMGVARARNLGAFLSRGSVLAFLDDDCEPSPNWLATARPWFDDRSLSGLEGAVRSDLCWNDGRLKTDAALDESAPLNAANLFIRTEYFNRAGGFDDLGLAEDSELTPRSKFGELSFSRDTRVFRPPR